MTLSKRLKAKDSKARPQSPKSPKHKRNSKGSLKLKRASTSSKLKTKASKDEDTYDINSISSNLDFNKSSSKLKKSQSTKDALSRSKKSRSSHSLSLLDAKKRKMHKEEKNKSRGGFTIHTNRRVRLDDGRIGIVKYKGRTAFGKSSEDWIGIVIEYGKGQHNGTVNGRSYFKCRDGMIL